MLFSNLNPALELEEFVVDVSPGAACAHLPRVVVQIELVCVSELIWQNLDVYPDYQSDKDDNSTDVRPNIDKLIVTRAQAAQDAFASMMIDSVAS